MHGGQRKKGIFCVGSLRLGIELKDRGAVVSFLELPESSGVKCGLDDFFVSAGAFPLETFQGCKRYALDHSRFKTLAAWHQKWERRQRENDRGVVKTLADEILTRDHFAKDAGGQLHVFEAGVYRPHGEERVARQVKRLLELNGDAARWSSHRARAVAEIHSSRCTRPLESAKRGHAKSSNGLLDLPTGVLNPHTADHLSSVQLPVAFDPTATCPLWETFADRVLPGDCPGLPFEILASAMRGDVSDQKAILLVGSGDNGKTHYFRL